MAAAPWASGSNSRDAAIIIAPAADDADDAGGSDVIQSRRVTRSH